MKKMKFFLVNFFLALVFVFASTASYSFSGQLLFASDQNNTVVTTFTGTSITQTFAADMERSMMPEWTVVAITGTYDNGIAETSNETNLVNVTVAEDVTCLSNDSMTMNVSEQTLALQNEGQVNSCFLVETSSIYPKMETTKQIMEGFAAKKGASHINFGLYVVDIQPSLYVNNTTEETASIEIEEVLPVMAQAAINQNTKSSLT